jgi:hypothetical protein
VRVKLVLDVDDEIHNVRGKATFMGRRIGDAYPVPPPDPYFGEASGARRRTGAGTIVAVRAQVRAVVESAGR